MLSFTHHQNKSRTKIFQYFFGNFISKNIGAEKKLKMFSRLLMEIWIFILKIWYTYCHPDIDLLGNTQLPVDHCFYNMNQPIYCKNSSSNVVIQIGKFVRCALKIQNLHARKLGFLEMCITNFPILVVMEKWISHYKGNTAVKDLLTNKLCWIFAELVQ